DTARHPIQETPLDERGFLLAAIQQVAQILTFYALFSVVFSVFPMPFPVQLLLIGSMGWI
ncbi:hypothetical protein, partial [Aeromonas sobria]|uniref:hypothetical protein n=1 Tax=Aeromonas sobria TaxID=646 RepID=UPI00195987E9